MIQEPRPNARADKLGGHQAGAPLPSPAIFRVNTFRSLNWTGFPPACDSAILLPEQVCTLLILILEVKSCYGIDYKRG